MDNQTTEKDKYTLLKNLAEEYGFDLNVVMLDTMIRGVPAEMHLEAVCKEGIEIINIIKFLRCCKGGDIKLSGDILNPDNNQRRGWRLDTKVTYQAIIENLESSLIDMLEDLGIIGRNDINEYIDNEYIDDTLAFLSEEKKSYNQLTDNATMGRILNSWYTTLEYNNIWTDCTKKKKYSFLYDYLVIVYEIKPIGKGYSSDIGREKAQYVRNCINAYKNQSEKD